MARETESQIELMRVSKQHPCPICQKPNWCLIFKDVALCMRVSSPRSYTFKNSGETGYFHKVGELRGPTTSVEKPRPEPVINVGKLMQEWTAHTEPIWLIKFAANLGVSPLSLMSLGCAWAGEHNAWAFPMRDGYGNMIGVRLRSEEGAKWTVRGTHQGIFIQTCPEKGGLTALICEGPTDTAAALTLGYFGLGRPSNCGGLPHLKATLRRLKIPRAAIIADNDERYRERNGDWEAHSPGMDGATSLAQHLMVPSCIIALPAKDLREFVRLGGTRELLDSMIEKEVWT